MLAGSIIVGALLATAPEGAGRSATTPVIVVTGRRAELELSGMMVPELSLDSENIAAFGANSVSDVLDALEQHAGGTDSPPLVLVNGERMSGGSDISGLPAEAIERIDILPEEAALRFGGGRGVKVVNIILKSNFYAITSNISYSIVTDGGRPSKQAEFDISRIVPSWRWNLHGTIEGADQLVENERPIDGGLGRFRSLEPELQRYQLQGSYTRNQILGARMSLSAQLAQRNQRRRTGSSAAPVGPPTPLETRSRFKSAGVGAAIDGSAGDWSWSFAINGGGSSSLRTTEIPAPASSAGHEREIARTRDRSADLELLTYGSPFSMPAGPVNISGALRASAHHLYAHRETALSLSSSNLARERIAGYGSVDIPMTSQGDGLAAVFGGLSVNGSAEIAGVSDFGSLQDWSVGGRWAPDRRFSATVSFEHHEEPPDIGLLGDPVTRMPNVRLFDYATGDTVDVLRIDGGNPGLRVDRTHQWIVGVNLRPLADRNFLVSSRYSRRITRDVAGSLSTTSQELQTAFPARFVRGGDGRLIAVDSRAVNYYRAESEQVRTGFSYFVSLDQFAGEREADLNTPVSPDEVRDSGFDLAELTGSEATPAQLQLSLHHTVRLVDEVMISRNGPVLDYLEGTAAGSSGGQPRHEVELTSSFYARGLGARLTGKWQSATRVELRPGSGLAGDRIRFSARTQLDLRLFADLGRQAGWVRRWHWLRGMRVSVEIENLLNDRIEARDAAGVTPPALQQAYLDPRGRTVTFSLRKQF